MWSFLLQPYFWLEKIDKISSNDNKVLSDKKLARAEARKHATRITREGTIWFSRHAKEEMKNDSLEQIDITNVLLSADARIHKEADFENGTYRYCVETARIAVVVSFNEDDSMTIVTAWRKRQVR